MKFINFIRFDSEEAARELLDEKHEWMPQSVIVSRAVCDNDGNLISPESRIAGYFAAVLTADVNPMLRERALFVSEINTGKLVYRSPDFDQSAFAACIIEPTLAGRPAYKFEG